VSEILQTRRKKILFLSDHPLVPSGVGIQAKLLIEGLLETGEYRFICFGGAISHPNYQVQSVAPEKFGEGNWIIIPVDGHGNKEQLRSVLYAERPDAVVMFTDPRFFYWLWEMEDEVRAVCPLLYWHVWDDDPTPRYNKVLYDSTDYIAALSLKTYGILQDIGYPKERFSYIPHSLHDELFKPLPEDDVMRFKVQNYGPHGDPKKFVVFWNNRNARRKMPGDVLMSFKLFLDEVGKDKAALMIHSHSRDPEGQDLIAVADRLGIVGNVIFSEEKVDAPTLNWFYNVADVTINISSNEGFGLGTLESLFAGTPIVANFTGGLQFQLGDWWEGRTDFSSQDEMTKDARRKWSQSGAGKANWWGAPVFPNNRALVGGQTVPYIFDDRVETGQVAKAIHTVYKMGRRQRKQLGLRAREWAVKNFGRTDMIQSWDKAIKTAVGAWSPSRTRSVAV
jgi:glycosyltransferase involved in cell wall biosynthesis